jgi:F0F1-type ATP synthase assembly protein I
VSETVELRFVVDGDSSGATTALDRAGTAVDDVDTKFRKGSEGMASGFDRASDAADNTEERFEGFAYTLSGSMGLMAGVGQVAEGDLAGGLAMAAMGGADLAQGFRKAVLPALQAMSLANLKSAASTATSTVATVAHRAASIAAGAASKVWAAGQWLLNAALTANPIGLIILAIVALVAAIVIAYRRSETFRRIVQAAMRGTQIAFGWVLQKVQQLVGWIRANWPRLLAILTGPIGLAVRFILSRWDSIRSGVVTKTAALIGFVRSIPGRIRGALGNLGGLLLGAAGQVIQGFIDGLWRGFDRVRSTLSTLTSFLPDWKGPRYVDENILRPSGDMVAGGFERGFVDRFTGRTRAVMGDLTTSLPPAAGSGRGAAAGGGDVHIHTPAVITNERQLVQIVDRAEYRVGSARTYVRPGV